MFCRLTVPSPSCVPAHWNGAAPAGACNHRLSQLGRRSIRIYKITRRPAWKKSASTVCGWVKTPCPKGVGRVAYRLFQTSLYEPGSAIVSEFFGGRAFNASDCMLPPAPQGASFPLYHGMALAQW